MGHTDSSLSGVCTFTGQDGIYDAVADDHECSTVAEVVAACLAALADIDGAAVAMMTGPDARQTIYASDVVIAAMEDLQFLLGQGPCWEAFTTATPVLVADLQQHPYRLRWPAYLPEVSALGVAAIFAVPVGVATLPLGVLDLYRTTPGPLRREQALTACRYADAAAHALFATASLRGEMGSGDGHRDEVHQAVGFVMAQTRSDTHEALLRLRAHAYATERSLDDVCHDVVTRRLRLTR
ncbi:GAF and ANTAR domain-containing protein [Actinoplanes sp. NPDC051633]|uniref:GAF and ANTAR domain-containing protein n=1 Tax=Actinoplanes sp. NPDC051633 TaxID=3155670 RepID=UPI0034202FED